MPIQQISYASFASRPHHKLGFCSTLTIIFILLKLIGWITWSWWWVFSPLWLPILFVLLMLLFFASTLANIARKAGFDRAPKMDFGRFTRKTGYDPAESKATIIDQPARRLNETDKPL